MLAVGQEWLQCVLITSEVNTTQTSATSCDISVCIVSCRGVVAWGAALSVGSETESVCMSYSISVCINLILSIPVPVG